MTNAIATPYHDCWKDAAVDASLTISDLQSRVKRLQQQLVDEQRARAEAQANVARLKRNELLRNERRIPTGDMERGYFCDVCGTEIDAPFEWEYCPCCGTRFDWRTRNDELGDENAYDLAGDR